MNPQDLHREIGKGYHEALRDMKQGPILTSLGEEVLSEEDIKVYNDWFDDHYNKLDQAYRDAMIGRSEGIGRYRAFAEGLAVFLKMGRERFRYHDDLRSFKFKRRLSQDTQLIHYFFKERLPVEESQLIEVFLNECRIACREHAPHLYGGGSNAA